MIQPAPRPKITTEDIDEAFNTPRSRMPKYEPPPGASPEFKRSAEPLITRLASTIEPESVRWLWPGRVPLGKITLASGEPGQGKSLLALDLAARVSTGAPMPDEPEGTPGREPAKVFIAAGEDDWGDTVVPRLIAAGADLSRIHSIVSAPGGGLFTLSQALDNLIATLERHTDAQLIVIDPLLDFLGPGVDANRGDEVRGKVFRPLKELAEARGVAVFIVHHNRKSTEGGALQRVGNSGAILAAARVGWAVLRDQNDRERRLLLPLKNNLAPDSGGLAFRVVGKQPTAALHWERGIVTITADEALAPHRDASPRDEAKEFLREELADGSLPAKEVFERAKANGIADKTVRRAAKNLGVVKRKAGLGGWEWSLPALEADRDAPAAEDAQLGEDAHDSPTGPLGHLRTTRAPSDHASSD